MCHQWLPGQRGHVDYRGVADCDSRRQSESGFIRTKGGGQMARNADHVVVPRFGQYPHAVNEYALRIKSPGARNGNREQAAKYLLRRGDGSGFSNQLRKCGHRVIL